MKIPFFRSLLSLLAFTLLSFAPLSLSFHEHYISLTKIDYAQEEKALQITMRFFIDDLEKALENRFETSMKLATDEEAESADSLIERYLEQKFKVSVNGQAMPHDYLGKQYENDEVFFFLEIGEVEGIESLEVQNSMLFEVFEEQQNYVKISLGETRKTFILIKANDKEMLKLSTLR